MSNCSLLDSSVRTCRSETEIRNLFERHMKALLEQKSKMFSEIDEWENNLLRQIQENVVKQKATVEQICKEQVHHLKTNCQEFLETALIYEERRDREEVRRLLEQCHALKVAINIFEYPEQPIPFIQLREAKQSVNVQRHSTIGEGFGKVNKDQFRSLPSSFNQTKLPLLKNSSATANDPRDINKQNLVEQCPTCFVTFPSTMNTDERSKHVNQHYGD